MKVYDPNYFKEYYQKNKQRYIDYYHEHRDTYLQTSRDYYQQNKSKIKQYYENKRRQRNIKPRQFKEKQEKIKLKKEKQDKPIINAMPIQCNYVSNGYLDWSAPCKYFLYKEKQNLN